MRRALAFPLAISLACTERPPARPPAIAPSAGPFTFEVTAAPGGDRLDVAAAFPAGSSSELAVVEGAGAFVSEVEAFDGESRVSVTPRGGNLVLRSCVNGCRVHYRYDLAGAAALGERGLAMRSGRSIEAPPSTWLLRPLSAARGTVVRFHVTSAPGDAFAVGLPRVAPDTYEARTNDALALPYAAFGALHVLPPAPGNVEVAVLDPGVVDESAVRAWADDGVRAFESFYGGTPTGSALVLVLPSHGVGVGYGSTMGWEGAAIVVSVGRDATRESLHDDWTLVHELVHTALPNLDDDHHWLEEGLASYVEPLARARAGLATDVDVWRGFLRGMPYGRPEDDDEGLDVTHTWGRTYWGGALFCLLADVTIRERTHSAHSLDDGLRAVVAAGGTIKTGWPIERVLEVADAATGQRVLTELYARMARHREDVDLPALFARLGVSQVGDRIVVDDSAPLAPIRKAMTSRP